MKATAYSLLAACLAANLACANRNDPGQQQFANPHRATIVEDDGTVSYYMGKNVATILAHGEIPGAPGSTEGFTRLRVSRSLALALLARPTGVLTMSMEQGGPDVVELTIFTAAFQHEDGKFDTFMFRAGDPFVTGYVQIVDTGTIERTGYAVTKWIPNTLGGYSRQEWESAIANDPGKPPLHYNGPPESWPPVPESWEK